MNISNESPQFGDVLAIPSNPEDLFTLLYQIGTGGFGKVYKAMHNQTSQIFAVKIIDYTKDLKSNKKSISFNYQSIQQETNAMRAVQKNDYIVKYYGSYYSRKSNTVWLILEYCACGSAVDLMLAMDRTLSEIEVSTIIEQILKGLINIHKINLIHRDVKGSNLLLSEDGTAKLGDFGVGVQLTDEEYRTSKKGSPYWMSPQVILNEKYDTKTDIWSLGITCVELVEGEPPNGDLKPMKVMEKIACNPPKVEDIINVDEHTDEFIDFVRLCLEIDPSERPTAAQLIKHPFITKLAQGKKYLAELIKNNIDKVEEYRREEEEKDKNNNNKTENDNENDNDNENENGNYMEDNNNNNEQLIPNLSETNSLKSIGNNYNQENNNISIKSNNNSNNSYAHNINNEDEKNDDFKIVNETENNNGSMIINDEEQNGSLNLVQNNSMLIYDDDNNKSIKNEGYNDNNEYNNEVDGYNNDYNSMIIKDEENNEDNNSVNINEGSVNGKNGDNLNIPDFMKFIESDNFIDSDEKYIEIMKKRQIQEMKEKYEYLKSKKEKKKLEEKGNEKEKIVLNDIIKNENENGNEININIQTPSKKESNKDIIVETKNKDNNNDNDIININKNYTEIKQNQPCLINLIVNEEKESKEKENIGHLNNNNNNNNNAQNQRSCITSNFTQANSKNNSSDGKNNFNSNLILNNKNKTNNNKNNLVPLSRKLVFYDNINEDENKQDTSNINESENEEERTNPINSVVNINIQDNKLEKSFEDKYKYYGRTEVKQRKYKFDKIKFEESKNNFNLNLNVNDEDNVKSIHISSFKPHKKYFK
jgi:serine/threonine protein kinase